MFGRATGFFFAIAVFLFATPLARCVIIGIRRLFFYFLLRVVLLSLLLLFTFRWLFFAFGLAFFAFLRLLLSVAGLVVIVVLKWSENLSKLPKYHFRASYVQGILRAIILECIFVAWKYFGGKIESVIVTASMLDSWCSSRETRGSTLRIGFSGKILSSESLDAANHRDFSFLSHCEVIQTLKARRTHGFLKINNN